MKRIDFINLFLIIVIIYYLFKNKDIIEGNEESGGTKCSHLETCRSYPYEYKSGTFRLERRGEKKTQIIVVDVTLTLTMSLSLASLTSLLPPLTLSCVYVG